MNTQGTAELLEKAKAVLAAVCDNVELHASRCPQCNMGKQACQTARFWADEAEDAERVVLAFQQKLRRDTLAAAR